MPYRSEIKSNQCDGCNQGLPIVLGIHMTAENKPFMACTKRRYRREIVMPDTKTVSVHTDANVPETNTDELLVSALKALCLTHDYVGSKMMPAINGYEWYDIGQKLSDHLAGDEWSFEFIKRRNMYITKDVRSVFKEGDWVVGTGDNVGCSMVSDATLCNYQPFSYLNDYNPNNFRLATPSEIEEAKHIINSESVDGMDVDFNIEAAVIAENCFKDSSTPLLNSNSELLERITQAITYWMNTAAQNQLNTDFYRGLVVECGKSIGERAFIADDGSKHDSVLCAKVPEIIESDYSSNKSDLHKLDDLLAVVKQVAFKSQKCEFVPNLMVTGTSEFKAVETGLEIGTKFRCDVLQIVGEDSKCCGDQSCTKHSNS